jgi:hypothetical protein
VTLEATIAAMNLLCFGGFRTVEDVPPKPWRLRTEALQRPKAQVGMVFGDHKLARVASRNFIGKWTLFSIRCAPLPWGAQEI